MSLPANFWYGVSFEVGGEIVIGHNYAEGMMFCASDPLDRQRYFTFATKSISAGLGLGGSVQAALVLGLNIAAPVDVPDTNSGVDFSLDLAIAGTSKYLKGVPEYLKFC